MAAKLGDCQKLGKLTKLLSLSQGRAEKFFLGSYLFLAMLVGSVKNASLFQKFTLNLIGFRVGDLTEPIWRHSSFPVRLIET